jgi:flagellar biosynthesis protein FlhA
LALGVVGVIALLIVPLPPGMLDVLLALSIGTSIIVLLVTVFTSDPLEFSIFPSMLLLITLLRLGLNVNSTRLILGTGSAGSVIAAFGNAVIGGNYVVGLVIFLILVVINFMVITKGSGRIAEVAARFTLDALPGRQMSIDADLSAGLIDENEARERRHEINRYADFYGAMDGAAKFVRGDAVAGLIITGINLVGGLVIGMTQRGMDASEALTTYTMLTVGDGLVTQIPALIVSTAAGMIVTYGSNSPSVGPAMISQFTAHPTALWITSGIMGLFAVVPGFPAAPFLLLAAGAGATAWKSAKRKEERKRAGTQPKVEVGVTAEKATAPDLRELLHIDPLELEVGYALVPLVDESQRGDLLRRIGLMRKQVALELGIIVPPVRVRDNIQLPATEYAIKLRGVRVARGEVMPQYLLALNTGNTTEPLDGIQTTDPSFGLPAVWIQADRRVEAEAVGYSVVEPQTVLSTHLMETIKHHAGELLGRQDTQELLDALKETSPALVEELIPGKLPLGTVHRVLQRLLREGLPIRDLVTILEALADASEHTKDPELLTERVRRGLATVISQLFDEDDGTIKGITIGSRLETALMTLFGQPGGTEQVSTLQPNELTAALTELNRLIATRTQAGDRAVLITPPSLRLGVRRLIDPILPNVSVVSLAELPPQTAIQSLATWELPHAA